MNLTHFEKFLLVLAFQFGLVIMYVLLMCVTNYIKSKMGDKNDGT